MLSRLGPVWLQQSLNPTDMLAESAVSGSQPAVLYCPGVPIGLVVYTSRPYGLHRVLERVLI
jgi:hypothetical protein